MFVFVLAIVIGLVLLVWSSDKFVDGASALAAIYGMAPLLIGIVIMGFGTSAPEMLVSVLSAVQGSSGLALGNAFGSNIANIALILGVTSIFVPMTVHKQVVVREMPLLLLATVIILVAIYNQYIGRVEAIGLLVVFAIYIWSSIRTARKAKAEGIDMVEDDLDVPELSLGAAYFWLIVGLVVMVASSNMLVYGASGIARAYHVSDMIIGLTIVAVGTSLPELAASLTAARKGNADMAIGNVIGSNMFNTLLVIGMAGAIAPMQVGPEVFMRDGLSLLAMTVLFYLMTLTPRGKDAATIGRVHGGVLTVLYIAYIAFLVYQAVTV